MHAVKSCNPCISLCGDNLSNSTKIYNKTKWYILTKTIFRLCIHIFNYYCGRDEQCEMHNPLITCPNIFLTLGPYSIIIVPWQIWFICKHNSFFLFFHFVFTLFIIHFNFCLIIINAFVYEYSTLFFFLLLITNYTQLNCIFS